MGLQQITITNLEQTCQEPKEQQVVAHIKFEKEKINSNYCPNLGLEMSI
jgi:hypothetical protein